jgi:hypothetical protein
MALFTSETHQGVWIESHCGRCYYGRGIGDPTQEQCPILTWALAHDRKPKVWERNPRKGLLMADTKCHKETRRPPIADPRGVVADETLSMFDVESSTVAMDSEHQ